MPSGLSLAPRASVPLPLVRHVQQPGKTPVIGVTLDSEPAGGYAKLPWYALRENYCDVVAAAGGPADRPAARARPRRRTIST